MTRLNLSSFVEKPILGTITLLVGGVALFAASQPAIAADATTVDGVRTMRVAAPASELATWHGRKAVQGRVQRAAISVCVMDHPRNFKAMAERRACMERAVSMSRLQMAAILAARPALAAASSTASQSPSATSPEEPSVL